MKAKEVMQILRISNPTLSSYVKKGWIKTTTLPNGRYNYDEESVYDMLNAGIPRKTYLYGRVSTKSQKDELQNQFEMLKTYCVANGIRIDGIFADKSSEVSTEFFKLLDDVFARKVSMLIITHSEVLPGLNIIKYILNTFGTKLLILVDTNNFELDLDD